MSELQMTDKEWFLDFAPDVMFICFGNLLPQAQSQEIWRRARDCADRLAWSLYAAAEERQANAQAVLKSVEDPEHQKQFKEMFGFDSILSKEPYFSNLKKRAGVE